MQPVRLYYQERVLSNGRFALAVRLAAVGPLLGALAALRDPALRRRERLLAVVTSLGAAALLALLAPWLLSLDIEVATGGLRFRLGPFRRTLSASAIANAEARPYPALAFGGWGWRYGWPGGEGAQAYSVPFVRSGVRVRTRDGKTYYLSSRAPEELASAILDLQHGEGAA